MIAWLLDLLAPVAHAMRQPQFGIPLSLALWGIWATVVWWRDRPPPAPTQQSIPHDRVD